MSNPGQTAHTYSFLDVMATMSGPSGVVSLGSGSGAAKEGISVEPSEDVATQTNGADGQAMFSLHAARPARVTVRVLKTSPANAILSQMFAAQTASAALYGKNTLVVSDIARGDLVKCLNVGFTKFPGITWAEDANYNEWAFMVGYVSFMLGAGG